MSYLPAVVMGRWFHLYLILDLYSRKIVGAEVHDSDDADHYGHAAGNRPLEAKLASARGGRREQRGAFVRDRLSAYAYPRLVEFVPVLPKTLTGKIRRIELRERAG